MADFAILGGLVALMVGVLTLVFWRGHRRRGLYLIAVAILAVGIGAGLLEGDAAREAGFVSAADRRDAAAAGTSDPAEWRAIQAAEQQAAADAAEAEDAELRRKGFHCLSTWSGAHRGVVAAVKAQLRNPDSFEHIETRITPVSGEGAHQLFMDYRAENGFGGMTISTALAVVQQVDCAFLVTQME